MSNNAMIAHNRFDALRREFHNSKKVGPFFAGMFDLAKSPEAAVIRSMVVSEYNYQAAKLPADKFAACAEKYGFPIKMESN